MSSAPVQGPHEAILEALQGAGVTSLALEAKLLQGNKFLPLLGANAGVAHAGAAVRAPACAPEGSTENVGDFTETELRAAHQARLSSLPPPGRAPPQPVPPASLKKRNAAAAGLDDDLKRSNGGSSSDPDTRIGRPKNAPLPNSAGAAGARAGANNAENRGSRGLRHFSMRVCRKVEELTKTTYSEVADALVAEYAAAPGPGDAAAAPAAAAAVAGQRTAEEEQSFDEKNIRRRVYDALNVLIALEIVAKERKTIVWKGLPNTAGQNLDMARRSLDDRMRAVQEKREGLRELIVQHLALKNLVLRNQAYDVLQKEGERRRQATSEGGSGSAFSSGAPAAAAASATLTAKHETVAASTYSAAAAPADELTAERLRGEEHDSGDRSVALPFVLVSTSRDCTVRCDMSESRLDVSVELSRPFSLADDSQVLQRLGLHKCREADVPHMLAPELLQEVPEDVYTGDTLALLSRLKPKLLQPSGAAAVHDSAAAAQQLPPLVLRHVVPPKGPLEHVLL